METNNKSFQKLVRNIEFLGSNKDPNPQRMEITKGAINAFDFNSLDPMQSDQIYKLADSIDPNSIDPKYLDIIQHILKATQKQTIQASLRNPKQETSRQQSSNPFAEYLDPLQTKPKEPKEPKEPKVRKSSKPIRKESLVPLSSIDPSMIINHSDEVEMNSRTESTPQTTKTKQQMEDDARELSESLKDVFPDKSYQEKIETLIQSNNQLNQKRKDVVKMMEDKVTQELTPFQKHTEKYINTIIKQNQVLKDQLIEDTRNAKELEEQLKILESDFGKQQKDLQKFASLQQKYEREMQLLKEAHVQKMRDLELNIQNKLTSPLEQKLQKKIATLEQQLYNTTKMLNESNINSKSAADLIDMTHIPVNDLVDEIKRLQIESKQKGEAAERVQQEIHTLRDKINQMNVDSIQKSKQVNQETLEELDAAKHSLRIAQDHHIRLTGDYETCKKTQTTIKHELDRVRAEQEGRLIELKQELETVKKDREYHEQRYLSLNNNKDQLIRHAQMVELTKHREELDNLRLKHNSDINEKVKQINDASSKYKALETETMRKLSEVKSLEEQLSEARSAQIATQAELKKQTQKLQEEIYTYRTRSIVLEDDLNMARAELASVKVQVDHNNAWYRKLETSTKEQIRFYETEKNRALQEKDKAIIDLRNESARAETLRRQMEQIQYELATANKTGSSCEVVIANLKSQSAKELDQLQKELQTIKTQHYELTVELAKTTAAHKHSLTFKNEIEQERVRLKECMDRNDKLSKEIAQLTADKAISDSQSSKLSTLLHQCSLETKDARVKESNCQEKLQQMGYLMNEEKNKMQQLINQQQQALQEKDSYILELNKRIASLDTTLRETKDSHSKALAHCGEISEHNRVARDAALQALTAMQQTSLATQQK
jgi:chromosome segregation ATPase